MDENATYHIPAGFNPWQTLDALRGLADAIHQFITEGPGAEDQMTDTDKASLDGLVHLLRTETYALHDYFTALGDSTTLHLPRTDFEFEALHVKHARKDEVREPAAVYAIR